MATNQLEYMIPYYHQARRYLREHDPVRHETASRKEIENMAQVFRHEAFLRHIDPYLQQKVRLLTDFYSLQARVSAPQPDWLVEALADWDSMIAIEAQKFGYEWNQGISND